MHLSLVSDASVAYFHAVSGLLTPWQQATDHERTVFGVFVCSEAPIERVLFSMNYLDKTKRFQVREISLEQKSKVSIFSSLIASLSVLLS